MTDLILIVKILSFSAVCWCAERLLCDLVLQKKMRNPHGEGGAVFQSFGGKNIFYTSFACCSPVLPKRRSRRW
jgi:hypothetical protein